MHIHAHRNVFTDESTISMVTVNDDFVCNLLEDTDRRLEDGNQKVYGRTAIPRGFYEIKMDYSPKYKRNMPHVLDVPQYEGIRIHPGNKADDTEGCLIPGYYDDTRKDWVSNSKVAYEKLLSMMLNAWTAGEKVTLEIS